MVAAAFVSHRLAKLFMTDLCQNKRARFSYELLETFEAGMVLLGTEIKSLRNHGGSIAEAYVIVSGGEAYLKNATIAPYSHGTSFNHEDKRDRKLLMHKYEIEKLSVAMQQKGLTIVPLAIYLSKGRAKLKLALARGKKTFDKRSDLKKREQEREIARALKNR